MTRSVTSLPDFIDTGRLQPLCSSLYDAFGLATSIVTADGVLVARGGKEAVCNRFYHRHPEARRLCAQFDRRLLAELKAVPGPRIFKCRHGLMEAAIGLRVENELVGILFSGPFLHQDPGDRQSGFFAKQAAEYGFDKDNFTAAIKGLPVISATRLKAILTFLEDLAGCIVELAHARALERLTAVELARAYWKSSQDRRHLERLNQALKAMLDHRETEKQAIEADLSLNIRKHILPYLEQMEDCNLDQEAKTLVKVIKANMDDLLAPLSGSLPAQYRLLTPAECKVADLVRQGMSTKQIAKSLFLSHHTVTNIRNSIRKKLGLTGKKQSLKTFLDTLTK